MSLSRPLKFPLFKLPFLCIESVIKNWNIVDIIFFAVISQKTRRIVKSFKIPLRGIELHLLYKISIELGMYKMWKFRNNLKWLKWFFNRNSRRHPLVLERNTIPLYTSRTNDALKSYSDGNEVTALKMAMEFLNDVFKCSVEHVSIREGNMPVSGDIGVKSTVTLGIRQDSSRPFGYAQSQKLNLLLENLEVTGKIMFYCEPPIGGSTEKEIYVDPKLFKCRELVFWSGSGAWITREILLQFEVPRLTFFKCLFSVEDIQSFVTNWFHSYNKKLEYLCIELCGQISSKNFQTKELNPVPFSGRTRIPSSDSFRYMYVDFSKGLEIVRHDGLSATIHVGKENFMFYIWHDCCGSEALH